jgi:hypothetical protein
LNEPQAALAQATVQSTPLFAGSFVTVAATFAVVPTAMLPGGAKEKAIEIRPGPVTVSVAEADLLGSVTEVAVTTALGWAAYASRSKSKRRGPIVVLKHLLNSFSWLIVGSCILAHDYPLRFPARRRRFRVIQLRCENKPAEGDAPESRIAPLQSQVPISCLVVLVLP